jgi:hypothetical protein
MSEKSFDELSFMLHPYTTHQNVVCEDGQKKEHFLCQNSLFHYFKSLWEHEEASRLDRVVDVEGRTENMPEWLFGRPCGRQLFVYFCCVCQGVHRSAKKMEKVAFFNAAVN